MRLLALVILDRFADYVSDEVSERPKLPQKTLSALFSSNARNFPETFLSNAVMIRLQLVAIVDFARFEAIAKFVGFYKHKRRQKHETRK